MYSRKYGYWNTALVFAVGSSFRPARSLYEQGANGEVTDDGEVTNDGEVTGDGDTAAARVSVWLLPS